MGSFPFFKIFCLNAGRSTRSSQAGAEDNKPSSPWLCEPQRRGPANVTSAALPASLSSRSSGGGSLTALPSVLCPPAVGAPRGRGGGGGGLEAACAWCDGGGTAGSWPCLAQLSLLSPRWGQGRAYVPAGDGDVHVALLELPGLGAGGGGCSGCSGALGGGCDRSRSSSSLGGEEMQGKLEEVKGSSMGPSPSVGAGGTSAGALPDAGQGRGFHSTPGILGTRRCRAPPQGPRPRETFQKR